MSTAFNIPNITLTADIYWKHQPKEIRALQKLGMEAVDRWKTLALAGFQIDTQCMIYGWDPALVMAMRMSYGYVWYPSLLNASVVNPPGFKQADPNFPTYDPTNPPPGAIIVSIDARDYPEAPDLIAADEAAALAAGQRIGPFLFTDVQGFDIYANAPATSGVSPASVVTLSDGRTFDLIYTPGPFGFSIPHYRLRK